MAGSSNFLQFNPNQTNQESDSAYSADSLRSGGIPSGAILPSVLLNKLFYQLCTFVAAFAQMMANKGFNMSDANFNTLVATLTAVQTTADGRLPLQTVTYGPSITFDGNVANGFDVTLLGNVTSSSLLNVYPGQILTFVIAQDGVGGRTFSWPSNVIGAGAVDISPNAVSIQRFAVRKDLTVRPAGTMTVS